MDSLILIVALGAIAAGGVLGVPIGVRLLPMLASVGAALQIPGLLGARLRIGISDATFRKIVLGLLTLSGVALLASSLPKLR